MPSDPVIATARRGLLVFAPAVLASTGSIAPQAERTWLGAWTPDRKTNRRTAKAVR